MPKPTKPTFGSARAYARHRAELGLSGGTHTSVNKHIGTGSLRLAVRSDGLIDFAIADLEWKRNVMPPPMRVWTAREREAR